MFSHSTNTVSFFSVLIATLIFSLPLPAVAAAQRNIEGTHAQHTGDGRHQKPKEAETLPSVPPRYRIEVIPTGSFILEQPRGIAIDQSDNIYIGNNLFNGTSQLLKIKSSGSVLAVANFPAFIGGLAINRKNNVFGSLDNQTVFKLKNNNAATFATGLPPFAAEQLAIDKKGNLFIAYFNAAVIAEVSRTAKVTSFASGFQGPFGVAFKFNKLFVGDNQNIGNGPGVIDFINKQGNVHARFGPIPGRIVNLEVDPLTRNFFIANQANGTVEVIAADGRITVFAKGFDEYPREIEFDDEGKLYVADSSRLYKITPPDQDDDDDDHRDREHRQH